MISDIIRTTRKTILNASGSEIHALTETNGLDDILKKRQEIIIKMNNAKKKAIEEAEAPYLEELEELDLEYATLLRFVGENGTA